MIIKSVEDDILGKVHLVSNDENRIIGWAKTTGADESEPMILLDLYCVDNNFKCSPYLESKFQDIRQDLLKNYNEYLSKVPVLKKTIANVFNESIEELEVKKK